MKIAICYNEKDEMYESYCYSWVFKLFGPCLFLWIASSSTEEKLIVYTKGKIHGKIKFIRIVEI